MESTVKERLNSFIDYKNITREKFCKIISVSPGYIGTIVESIPPVVVLRISKLFPELNTEWLLTGNGEMLNVCLPHKSEFSSEVNLILAEKNAEIERLKDKIIELQDVLLNHHLK